MMSNKQSHFKNAMMTGMLTVSLAGFTVPVFAKPGGNNGGGNKGGGGNPIQECQEHGASYFAKYDWEGEYVRSDDSVGDVDINGNANATSGTWSSNTAIDIMIVKGGTLRDPTTYNPAANLGSFDNNGIENKDISHITFCTTEKGSLPPEKLLATGVELTATRNGSAVDLTLTTSSEVGTAKLLIIRGNSVGEGSVQLTVACEFNTGDDSSGSSYSCTDTTPGDSYWAAEIEDDGDYILHY